MESSPEPCHRDGLDRKGSGREMPQEMGMTGFEEGP